jgi:PBSX family phage terminase large subunit
MIKVPAEFQSLYTTDKFINLVTGGRGGTKSFNVALFLLRLTYEEGHIILYTRYTMSSAKISIIPEFTQKLEMEGTLADFSVTADEITNKRTGSKILFRGIKTSSGNQTAKLKSIQGLTTFVVDEAEEWENEDDYQTILLSIRSITAKNRVIIIMNPSNRKHFIYQKYIKDTKKNIEIEGYQVEVSTHHQVNHIHTTYHKYKEYLAPNFFDELKLLKLDRDLYGHKAIGQWQDNPEGLLYPEIKYFSHELPQGANFSFTDVADTGDDYLCTWFVRATETNLYVYDAIYTLDGSGITIPLMADKMNLNKCVINWIESNNQGSVFVSQLQNKVANVQGVYENTNKPFRMNHHAHLMNFLQFKETGSKEYLLAIEHLRAVPKVIKNGCKGMDIDSADALTALIRYFYNNYPQYFIIR